MPMREHTHSLNTHSIVFKFSYSADCKSFFFSVCVGVDVQFVCGGIYCIILTLNHFYHFLLLFLSDFPHFSLNFVANCTLSILITCVAAQMDLAMLRTTRLLQATTSRPQPRVRGAWGRCGPANPRRALPPPSEPITPLPREPGKLGLGRAGNQTPVLGVQL